MSNIKFASKWNKTDIKVYFNSDVPSIVKKNTLVAMEEVSQFTKLNIVETDSRFNDDIEVRVGKLPYKSWVAAASYPPFGKITFNTDHIKGQGLLPKVAVHEFGHALGMRHTHDAKDLLDDWSDDLKNSVMSYKGYRRGLRGFSVLDVEALREEYGTELTNQSNNIHKASDFIGRTIVDDGGYDTLVLDVKRMTMGEAWNVVNQLKAKPSNDHVVLDLPKRNHIGILDTTTIEEVLMPDGQEVNIVNSSSIFR